MSVPYLSPTLSDMAQHANEMLQRERQTLCNAKRTLTNLRGDEAWVPCGMLETDYDDAIFDIKKVYDDILSTPFLNGLGSHVGHIFANGNVDPVLDPRTLNGSKTTLDFGPTAGRFDNEIGGTPNTLGEKQESSILPGKLDHAQQSTVSVSKSKGKEMNGHSDMELMNIVNGQSEHTGDPEPVDDGDKSFEDDVVDLVGPGVSIIGDDPSSGSEKHQTENESSSLKLGHSAQKMAGDQTHHSLRNRPVNGDHPNVVEVQDDEDRNEHMECQDVSQPAPRRMRTRAQAQAASEPTASSRTESPDSWTPPPIHRLFLIPDSAKPDPHFALSHQQADETRRLLTVYVQKQEEVCRGAEKLYEGLLRADRQRQTVLKWCKAEGHIGEMSDGEDWYDKEEWGLEEDLRKGQAEEEEDAGVQGKKTRGRRA